MRTDPTQKLQSKTSGSRNRIARSVWRSWSLLPVSMTRDNKQREQAPRTPDASRAIMLQKSLRPANNLDYCSAEIAVSAPFASLRSDWFVTFSVALAFFIGPESKL